jgi:undecaprenyl diphosphate synthase
MDGNGRWAVKQSLPRIVGHKRGIETVKTIVQVAYTIGIKILTLYAFSTENWKRPKLEIDSLLSLLVQFLQNEVSKFIKSGIRLRILGDLSKFPKNIREELNKVCMCMSRNTRFELNIALNYGARQELVHAFKEMLQHGIEDPTEQTISSFLYTAGQPDPDLLIRTSGEFRISNFLLWQIAYSEIYVTNKLWPDFTANDLQLAISEFQKRERRFGGINDNGVQK